MFSDITTALSSIKVANELVTLIFKTKVDSAVTQKAVELNSVILSLQSADLAIQAQNQGLLAENNRLKQELIDTKNWEAEAQKYSLTEIARGIFVYAINPDQLDGKPMHWLCTYCYEIKQKFTLQRGERHLAGDTYFCPNCKTELKV